MSSGHRSRRSGPARPPSLPGSRTTDALTAAIAASVVAALALFAVALTAAALHGRLLFEPATGTVTQCTNVGLRGERCTVAYTYQGVTRTTEVPSGAYEPGDSVRLRVDPGDPDRVRRGDFDGLWRVLIVDLLAVTLVTGALLELRRSRRRRAGQARPRS